MVCSNCATLADIQTGGENIGHGPISLNGNTHLNGGKTGTGLKCLYPRSCSCQHKQVGGKYVPHDENN